VSLNVGFQHEPYFILDWSPERIDHALNTLTGAGPLETAVALARRDRSSAQTDISTFQERVDDCRTVKARLSLVPAAREQLDVATDLFAAAEAEEQLIAAVSYAHRRIQGILTIPAALLGYASLAAKSAQVELSRADVGGRSRKNLKDASAALRVMAAIPEAPLARARLTHQRASSALDMTVDVIDRVTAVSQASERLQSIPALPSVEPAEFALSAATASETLARGCIATGLAVHAAAAKLALRQRTQIAFQLLDDSSLARAEESLLASVSSRAEATTLGGIKKRLLMAAERCITVNNKLAGLRIEADTLREKLEAEDAVCPTCGQPMPTMEVA